MDKIEKYTQGYKKRLKVFAAIILMINIGQIAFAMFEYSFQFPLAASEGFGAAGVLDIILLALWIILM